ncbi:MAG: YitT family protein [Bacteroides sp.]|nr:YitT family protein [Bacteroides sp.]
MRQFTKAEVFRTLKDYGYITFGLACYCMAWAAFMLPYQITTGGATGISAIIYYATGFPIQNSYFIINAVLITMAIKVLGPGFSIKTMYAIGIMTLMLWGFQAVIDTYVVTPDHAMVGGSLKPLLLGAGQDFMACIIGAVICGFGLGIVFTYNGSTGGTDIIAAVVNKYKDVSLGRMIMLCDVVIITTCYFVFHDWKRVIFGFVTLFIIGLVLDWVVNRARQSVQFFIFSKKYEEIADSIIRETRRGVTVLDGTGWYSKNESKVLVVLAKKRQSFDIFRLVKSIDPDAFISQSSVIGVYGEGFDPLKVK